jgi:hypothetical protein
MEGGGCDPDRSAHDAPSPVRLRRALPQALQQVRPALPERLQRRRRALRRLPQREGLRARAALLDQRPRLRLLRPATERAPRRSFRRSASARRRGDRFPYGVGALQLDPKERQRQPDRARRIQPSPDHAARRDGHRRAAPLALVPAHPDAPLQRRLPDSLRAPLRASALAVPVHLQAPTYRSTWRPALRAACRPRRLALHLLRTALALCRILFDCPLALVRHLGPGARRAAGGDLRSSPFVATPWARSVLLLPPPTPTLRHGARPNVRAGGLRRRHRHQQPSTCATPRPRR